MMSNPSSIHFSAALLAIVLLAAATAAPPLCPVTQLGTKPVKSLAICSHSCRQAFGVLHYRAVCLKKKRSTFTPKGLTVSCWCGCNTKKSKGKNCPPPQVQSPPPPAATAV
ncbi:hypothetical protein Salat_2242200 [Sesamum alatum]|uniref:Secreted protein n=1 Tax=Sesamum alatum TaxID=300844 RepID=A0AAE2CDQ4_9LAMI|nr:hypothetical protein Salat_2242200 [Sesamum alatum]